MWWPICQFGFGSTRSQVRILSPRLVIARVLGNTGNPFFLPARESAREQGVSGLALLLCGHGSVVAGVRTIRPEMGQSPSFSCISCRPSPMRSPAAEQQAPLGYGRQRPSFNVPRLCRGVHRPAAAALRSGAADVGVGAWPLSRGCGGLAVSCRWLAGVRPQVFSRGCVGTGHF